MLVPRKQWLFSLLTIILRQVTVQAGHSPGVTGAQLGLGHPKPPMVTALLPRQVVLVPKEATPPPLQTILGQIIPRVLPVEGHNPKWVINLSGKPLTQVQRSVLAKGPNFVVSPRHPPNLEYITAIESGCTKLSQKDAEELRADINQVLRSSHPSKCNLTKAQSIALRELKRDRDCIVLTEDKGVAMVIMDRQDYIYQS